MSETSNTDGMLEDTKMSEESVLEEAYDPTSLTDDQLRADWALVESSWRDIVSKNAQSMIDGRIIPEIPTLFDVGFEIFRELYKRDLCSDCEDSTLAAVYICDEEFQ